MSIDPIIISDEEEEGDQRTPLQFLSKKPTRWGPGPDPFPTVLVLDDDPTPRKPSASSSTPSFVAETPMSDFSVGKCTMDRPSNPKVRVSDPNEFAESGGSICLELENEDLKGGSGKGNSQEGKTTTSGSDEDESWWSSRFKGSMDSVGDGIIMQMSGETFSPPKFSGYYVSEVHGNCEKDNFSTKQMGNKVKQNIPKVGCNKLKSADEVARKKMTKEERNRIAEEKKLKKEQEKLQKAALKAQAAELKKMEKEKQKWEKGKFAVKSIVAEIDTKVVEQGSVGGHLLTRFAEKGLTYCITSNPIERSIVWTMNVPESVSQLSSEGINIQYVLLVYEAEEFCNLVTNNALLDHVANVQSCYPFYTLCYLTNRLMAYISKREKEQYKNPEKDTGWRCPPIEEVLAKLTTHYFGVHHRQCRDESELAEHVVDLTCSLASCQFRKKLTRLSVNANGSLIPKDSVNKNLIKKSPWLKALVAIPKVQPRFAIAIWKKYPTMKSLLRVYMDPSKSVHEKEFLLEHLATEGLLGADRRVGKICSKRIYRLLMAQSGGIKTDDVEDGADFFRHQSF